MDCYSQRSESTIYQNRKNIIKFNTTGLISRKIEFQAERVIVKPISIAFSYSTLPEGNIPLKDQLIEFFIDEEEEGEDILLNLINSASVGQTSFIPEIRFYLGQGYGKGFYIAPFYKQSKYDIRDANLTDYQLDDGSFESLMVNGKLDSNTFGLLLGAQFNLWHRVVVDCWFMGPHYGLGKSELIGRVIDPLSTNEIAMLSNQLSTISLPSTDTTIDITSEEVVLKTDGAWGGFRAGISLGIRF